MNLKEVLVWICGVFRLYCTKIAINTFFLSFQVYKYREHIFFLQQKFKQDGGTQAPSSPMFDMSSAPTQGHNLSRLYGSTATQYINEMLLQGNAQPKFPGSPLPDGKKPGPGKHGDGTGKQWQYQQVSYARLRQASGHIRDRRFRTTDVNQKFMFLPLGRFHPPLTELESSHFSFYNLKFLTKSR